MKGPRVSLSLLQGRSANVSWNLQRPEGAPEPFNKSGHLLQVEYGISVTQRMVDIIAVRAEPARGELKVPLKYRPSTDRASSG